MNSQTPLFETTPFNNLMQKRIQKILLISSVYDAFLLEDDGRIDEQIFKEYVELNLRFPPQFIHVTNEEKAFEILEKQDINLVITMLDYTSEKPYSLAEKIKRKYCNLPLVLLTPSQREITSKLHAKMNVNIDYVFSWLGNSNLLLAIIKLIEDKMNVEYDVKTAGVQTILIVEDSKRFYSSYLPIIYKIVLKQSKRFMTEALNDRKKMLRMRGRTKILLATNYEQAIEYYEKYKHNMLGVISDVSYNRNGQEDPKAGFRLARHIKNDKLYLPILLQSSEIKNKKVAKQIKVGFLYKMSQSLTYDLRNFVEKYFAFGEFIFVNPETGGEIIRTANLKELQENIHKIPDNSLQYHLARHHLSKWLNARALFSLGKYFQQLNLDDFKNISEAKSFIFNTLATFRLNQARGVIATFDKENYDQYISFARTGDGSVGGKARGLAFLDSMIKRNWIKEKYPDVMVEIPHTLVITTDIFTQFMEDNNLYEKALSDIDDNQLLNIFTEAKLPKNITDDIRAYINIITTPIAVRSSSLLEDSHYECFSEIYRTYMIANVDDKNQMLQMLLNAIKSIYASVYFKESKAYIQNTANVIDEEKMAVILQPLCGHKHQNLFYPSISGIAKSINYYPVISEKREEGIAEIAFGLGKYITEGLPTLRFSPKHPKRILQLSSTKTAIKETQKEFYALDLNPQAYKISKHEDVNLSKLNIKDAKDDNSLRKIVSVYDYQSDLIRDGYDKNGSLIVTFANVLKYNSFPLANILKDILTIAQKEMDKPVEIEFAVNFASNPSEKHTFNLLQIRPILENKEKLSEDLTKISQDATIVKASKVLGNGAFNNTRDLIYIKPATFDASQNPQTAMTIARLNDELVKENRKYILIGPGRWGSSDSWLGVPVQWTQISGASLIIEAGLENYRIEPGQGTHFFQNLISANIGYFTINPFMNDGFYDIDFLDSHPACYEDDQIRHIRFDSPAVIKISGRKGTGVILKPEEN